MSLARKYTTKIEIWQPTEVSDGYGGYTTTETMQKKVWAGVRTNGAGFKFQQFGLNDFKNPVIFFIRAKNNINFNEKTFIVYKGHRYEVKGFEDRDLDNIEITLYCDAT